jgi:hypothetical protein
VSVDISVVYPKGTYVRVKTINGGDVTSVLLSDYRNTYGIELGDPEDAIFIPADRIKTVEKAELNRDLIMAPSVHINGTSKEELLNQVLDVLICLRAALEAMAKAAPHGRDYYVQTSHAIHHAISQHMYRCRTIHELVGEYQQIACKISDQPK